MTVTPCRTPCQLKIHNWHFGVFLPRTWTPEHISWTLTEVSVHVCVTVKLLSSWKPCTCSWNLYLVPPHFCHKSFCWVYEYKKKRLFLTIFIYYCRRCCKKTIHFHQCGNCQQHRTTHITSIKETGKQTELKPGWFDAVSLHLPGDFVPGGRQNCIVKMRFILTNLNADGFIIL